MLLTSWLSSLRSKRFRRRVQKSAARKRQSSIIRQAEQLEDRTMLTAFTIDSLDLRANPGTGVEVVNDDIIGTGTQATPEYSTLVIETVFTSNAGISIDLNDIALETLVIESVDLDGFTGAGIDINLTNVTGLRTLVIESTDAHGNGPAVNIHLDNTDIEYLTVFDSSLDGVHLYVNGSAVEHGRIISNAISGGVGVDGIMVALDNGANIDGFEISDNGRISSVTEDSIRFDFNGVPVDGLIVQDNIFATGATVGVTMTTDGDTFSQPFSITNNSAPGLSLERMLLDIGPAGLQFDIDPITGRPFTPANGTGVTTGFVAPANVMPGGTTLDLNFTDFDSTERFDFFIDLDIAGAQTSVFGNELIGSTATLEFSGGQIITGVFVAIPGFPDAAQFVTAQGGSGGTGINFDIEDSPLTNLLIDGNVIQGNSGYGILFDALESDIQGVITNNQINATAEDGISFQLVDSNLVGDLITNAIGGNSGSGVSFLPSVAVSGNVATVSSSGQPLVVTSLGHGLQNGDRVVIAGVSGEDIFGQPVFGHNNPANGVFLVQNITANTFQLRDVATNNVIIANSFYKGGGTWFRVEPGEAGGITGASNTSDIEITSPNHGLTTGDVVTVQRVTGNLTANGTHVVTVTGANTFTLDGTSGVGDYISGPFGRSGVWYKTFIVDVRGSITENFISANTGAGIDVVLPQGTVFLGDLKRNVIENNNGIGLNVTTTSGSFELNVGSADPADSNTFDRNVGAGIAVNVLDTGSGSYRVLNNLFTAQQDDASDPTFIGAGFHTRLEGTLPTVEASPIIAVSEISGNTFGVDNLGNSGPGVLFGMGEGSRIDILDVSQNTFINNRGDGFRFFRRDDADLNEVVVDSNTFEGNRGDGVELFAQNTTRDPLDWRVVNNEITNNGEYGIRIRVEADARVRTELTNNTVDFNGRIGNDPNPNRTNTVGGIGLSAFQAVEVFMSLDNNRIRQNFGDGFSADATLIFDTLRLSGDWTNNTFDGNTANGVRTDGIGFGYSSWYDNTFNENGLDGAVLLNSDDFEIRSILRNEFIANGDDGLELGQAVNAVIGDGTVPNLNRFESNIGDGLKLTQAQSNYLASSSGVDSVGRTRHRDIIVDNNHFLYNGSAGIDAEPRASDDGTGVSRLGFVRLIVNNSIIFRNLGDGIEWKGTAGDSELTIIDSRITFNGDTNNPTTAQGGRGIDFMQAAGGTTDFNIFDSVISSNFFEGVYVVNTADFNQPQERPDDPLTDNGDQNADPHINFRFRDNIIESNGTFTINATIQVATPDAPPLFNGLDSSDNLGTTPGGTLGGLVIRVGSVDGNGRLNRDATVGAGVPIEAFLVTGYPEFVPREQLDGAGIDAEIIGNFFDGNFGSEVYFDSFRSDNPPPTRGNWHTGETPQFATPATFSHDALSRFDLVFERNETNPNNSLDVLNGFAWHNNVEPEFKSRAPTHQIPGHSHGGNPPSTGPNNPPGPHGNTTTDANGASIRGYRRRNATRTLGNPMQILPGVPLFYGFDGEGRSTWRVEPNWDIDPDFQTSEVFDFSSFDTTKSYQVPGGPANITGELNYDWDTGEATAGNPFSDTLSLQANQVFGLVIEPDQFEFNDPSTPYTNSDSIITAYNFGDLVSLIDTEQIGDGSASIEHGNEDDYFKFRALEDGTIKIDLIFDKNVGDIDFELMEITAYEEEVNTEEKIIGSSTLHDVSNAQITAEVKAGKEYIIRIFGFSSRTPGVTDNEYHPGTVDHYQLLIPLPIPHDQYESNDTFTTATDLGQVPEITGIMENDLSIHEAAHDNPGSGFVDEIEGNDTIWTAQDLTNAPWRRTINTNIEDFTNPDQKQLHNITVRATGDESFDYFKFHVPIDNARAIFDVDFGLTGNATDVDTKIFVYDSDGNLLAQNDDDRLPEHPTQETSTGSVSTSDSFLMSPFADLNGRAFFFETAGDYIVGVGRSDNTAFPFTESEADQNGIAGDELLTGSAYFLTIQVEDHQLGDPGDLDFFSFVAPSIDALAATAFYSIDVDTDELLRIDRFTSAVTVVGAIGHDMHDTDMVLLNGMLYAVTPDSDDPLSLPNWNLVVIDPGTGNAVSVTPITILDLQSNMFISPRIVEGLAARNGQLIIDYDVDDQVSSTIGVLDPTTAIITKTFDYDNLTGLARDFDGISLAPDGSLIAVDRTGTGANRRINFYELENNPFGITSLGNYTLANADVSDLAADGTHLFGLDHARNELVILNATSPATRLTTLTLPGGRNMSGLAAEYGSPTGAFYSIDTAGDTLVTIDQVTGAITPIGGGIGFDMQDSTDLTYLDGLIYAVTSDTQQLSTANNWFLVTINPATGTMIGAVQLDLNLPGPNNDDPTRVEGITASNGRLIIAYDVESGGFMNPDNDNTSTFLGFVNPASGDVTQFLNYEDVTGINHDFDALVTLPDGTIFAADNQTPVFDPTDPDINDTGDGTVEFFQLSQFPFDVTSFGTYFRINASVSDMAFDTSGLFGLDNGRNEFLRLDQTDPSNVAQRVPLTVGGMMLSGLTSGLNLGTPLNFGSLEVEIVSTELVENIDLVIYDANQNPIHSSTTEDGREVITFNYVPGAQYYAQVFGAPQNSSRNYSLNIKRVNPDVNEFPGGGDFGNEDIDTATDLGTIIDEVTVDGTIHRHRQLVPVPDVPTEDNNNNTILDLTRIFTPGTPPTFVLGPPWTGGWQDLRNPNVTPWTLTPSADIGSANANTSTDIPHTTVHGFVDVVPEVHYYLIEVENFGDRVIIETDYSNFDTMVFLLDPVTGTQIAANDDSSNRSGGGGSEGGVASETDSLIDTLATPLLPGRYLVGVATTGAGVGLTGITGGLMPRNSEYTLHISIENQRLSAPIEVDPGDVDVFTFTPSATGAMSTGFDFPDFSGVTTEFTTVGNATVPADGTAFLNEFISNSAGLVAPNGMRFGPDGNLYVITTADPIAALPAVLRFDGTTGAFIDVFVDPLINNGGLTDPRDLIFLPGGDLLVSSAGTNNILRFDGGDGSFIGVYATGNMTAPDGMAFGSDGNLYVANSGANNVVRFDGGTGAFIDVFVAANSAGLDEPTKIVFHPTTDDLFVSSTGSDEILFYHGPGQMNGVPALIEGTPVDPPGFGNTGVYVSDSEGGLNNPQGLAFDANGDLLVASESNDRILRFTPNGGANDDADFAGLFVPVGDAGLDAPRGLVINGGNVYVASSMSNEVFVSDTPSVLQIVPNSPTDQVGAAWNEDKQFVTSFDTTFDFQINGDPGGGSGFAFVIQNVSDMAIGGNLSGLGYDGIANSLAIEFDIAQSGGTGDPNDNHVSIHTAGMAPNSNSETVRLGRFNPTFDLNDGEVHSARITYSGGALSIYLEDLFNPAITVFYDIAGQLSLDMGTMAYVGFTGAANGQSIDILNWEYTGFEISDLGRDYNIRLDFEHDRGDLLLELFDPTFSLTTPIAVSDESGLGNDFELISETLAIGRTYFVRVSGVTDLSPLFARNPTTANGAASSGYSLTIDDLSSPLLAGIPNSPIDADPAGTGDDESPVIEDDGGLVEPVTPPADVPQAPVGSGGNTKTPTGETGTESGETETATPTLTAAQLAEMVAVAKTYWAVSGLSDAQLAALNSVSVTLVDLPGNQLGAFSGTSLTIDKDGADYGWYVDELAYGSYEFSYTAAKTQYFATPDSPAYGKIDLLTTLLHELGHAVGLDDLDPQEFGTDLMAAILVPGERRLPQSKQAVGATPDLHDTTVTHFLASPVDVDYFAMDTIDADVGDDVAEDESGNVSLRAAIMETNASAGFDIINVDAGTVLLTIQGNNEDNSETGDLDITDDLTIDGAGINMTFIDASQIFDRVFHIHAGANVTLSNMTITGGSPFFDGNYLNEGTLTLINVNLVDNFDTFTVNHFGNDTVDINPGDGIVEDAAGNRTLRAAIMESNATIGDDSIVIPAGTVALTFDNDGEDNSAEGDLDITDNVMIEGAGVGQTIITAAAIFDRVLHIHEGVTVELSNLTITGGTGLFGGGILNEGTLVLNNVEIVDNFSTSRGGGIMNRGILEATDTTIAMNHSESRGGGVFNDGGSSLATFSRSTLHTNTAGSRGGAIFNEGTIDFTNSTISGNFANSSGGGVFNEGSFDLLNATITLNTTDQAGGGFHNGSDGASASIHNTIVAVNFADPTIAAGNDLFGPFVSFGHNFLGDVDGSEGLVNMVDDDKVGGGFDPKIVPMLLPLDDYGGPTLTHMPNLGSPVRDAGDNLAQTEFDQRGFDRIFDGNDDTVPDIDIGSVEANFFDYGGRVWQDTNDNGIQNIVEPGIPNVQVSLFDAGVDMAIGGGDDVFVAGVLTDSQGNYNFENLFVGRYYVKFNLVPGHDFSIQNVGANDLTDSDVDPTTGESPVVFLTGGSNDQPQDAGMVPRPASVVATAFEDTNGDGIQDSGEAGIENVSVQLWSVGANGIDDDRLGDDVMVESGTTDANGDFTTTVDLAAGNFYLVFSTPTNLAFTLKDAGADTVDSDVRPYTGRTDVFVVLAGEVESSVDAGYVLESTIGNRVFGDTNLNGFFDPGEFGANGIGVSLYEAGSDGVFGGGNDILVATTTTAGGGFYSFANLAAGNFYLVFEKPDGFVYTLKDQTDSDPMTIDDEIDSDVDPTSLRTDVFALGSGVNDDTRDAGLIAEAMVGNRAFRDANRNGIQDFGEVGIAGITVQLWNTGADSVIGGVDDFLVGTDITNLNGEYLFESLEPGQYYLTFSEPIDLDFTVQNAGADDNVDSDVNADGTSDVFTLTTGLNDQSRDAGYVSETQVGDLVFRDQNEDGIQNPGEVGVAGVTVRLKTTGTDSIINENDVEIASTVTDSNGRYRFRELAAGQYYLEFDNPTGFSFSPVNRGGVAQQDSDVIPLLGRTALFNLAVGVFDSSRDAGLVPGANVGNFLWRDDNQDGVQQLSEPGVANVEVQLYNVGGDGVIGGGNDVLVGTTTTDVDGFYNFTDLPSGTYYVLFTDQAGFIFTLQNQSADDTIDSDVDFSGLSHSFSIVPGETNNTIDAGLITHSDARVGNLVFTDLNANGIQDSGDYGIGGVRVELFAAGADGQIGGGDDVFIKHIATNANGRYAFTNLAPGRYYIGFEEPVGFDFTLQDQGGNDQFDSDVNRLTGLTAPFTLASGQNNQSFDAGLLDLDEVPGTPLLTGPLLVDSNTLPTITWDIVPNAFTYDLLLYNVRLGTQIISQEGIIGNSFTVPTNLSPDPYQVFVRAVNDKGRSPFSVPRNFTITGFAPTAPNFTAPTGTTGDTTPTIQWTNAPGAASYELYVYHVASGTEVIRQLTLPTNQFTPPNPIPSGVHQAFIRAVNSVGKSPFGTPLFFTVSGSTLTPPTLLSPVGTTSNDRPTIDWSDTVGAGVTYELLVYNIAAGKEVIHETGLAVSEFTPTVALANAAHQVFVRAVNASTVSSFSAPLTFTVMASGASTPSLFAPAGNEPDHTPTFRWTSVAGATSYELLVYNVNAGQAVINLTGLNPAVTNFTPTVALPNGPYQGFVRAITPAGPSQYSSPLNFNIVSADIDDLEANPAVEPPADLPLAEGDVQLVASYIAPIDAAVKAVSTQEAVELQTVTMPEWNEGDVKLISDYGWQKAESAETDNAEEIHALMSEWHDIDWWSDDAAVETAALPTTEDDQADSADAAMAVAGAFAALGVHRLLREEETQETGKPAAAKRRSRRSDDNQNE